MTTYVAFLRGVNLGPHRKVSMPRLAEVARELGYEDVWTYLNSGNLVVSTFKEPASVEQELTDALHAEWGTKVDVTVRTADQLSAILAGNPFPDDSRSQVTVAFLTRPAPSTAAARLAGIATDAEPYVVDGQEVWVRYGDGQARSRLAATFSAVVGVSATVRTVGTVTKIVAKLTPRPRLSVCNTGETPAWRGSPSVTLFDLESSLAPRESPCHD